MLHVYNNLEVCVIEEITGVYTQGMSLVQSNPMLSTVFAVWGLSVITIVFWRVPSTIFRFIKEQYTTTFVVRSYGPGTESAFTSAAAAGAACSSACAPKDTTERTPTAASASSLFIE